MYKINPKKRVVEFTCDNCLEELNCPFDEAGTKQNCPICAASFIVPGAKEVMAAKQKEREAAEAAEKERRVEAERQRQAVVQARPSTPQPTAPVIWFYPQIVESAEWVRIGAAIFRVLGILAIIAGVIGLLVGAIMVAEAKSSDSSAGGWAFMGMGIYSVVSGILSVAFAEFFRMLSYTCEAIRVMGEHTVKQKP